MRGLFLKSLTIIMVTVVGSVLAMTLILSVLQTSPVASKLERQKREIALDLAQAILADQGAPAAMRFAATSDATLQLGISVTSDASGRPCEPLNDTDGRTLLQGSSCFQILLEPPEKLTSYRFAPIMLGLAVLLSSIVAAALLARNLISPVVLLRDGLSALAHGRFDARIAPLLASRKDEIAELACDFDRTAQRLEEHQNAQQRLFHDVSHELRSPLSRLQAATGIARKSPAKLEAMLDRIDREVERVDGLVGEVLTLARLADRGEAPLQPQALDVIEILNEILVDAVFEAQARQVLVTGWVPGSFLAHVDGELIYRALENVIRNATKYTAENTRVDVRCKVTFDALEVQVLDQGPGVGTDELDYIFQPFSRGAAVIRRSGYGLGLAIARHAIEMHGGQIRASLPTNGGLAVALEIPRHPPSIGKSSQYV